MVLAKSVVCKSSRQAPKEDYSHMCRRSNAHALNLRFQCPDAILARDNHSEEEVRLLSTVGFLVGAEIERARLETENSALSDRLETRKAVDRAKGVLQRDLMLDEAEAYRRMQRESRQRRKSMREIAEAILLSDDMRKPKPVEAASEKAAG
jgi:hypothetical protein